MGFFDSPDVQNNIKDGIYYEVKHKGRLKLSTISKDHAKAFVKSEFEMTSFIFQIEEVRPNSDRYLMGDNGTFVFVGGRKK